MRESCLNAFNSYVDRYDVSDERIALKVEHTYEVAELCDEIARGEGLSPADVDLAWLCGLLHDIGRFEQLRQWGTFSDADSCSHAALGIQVLKDEMGSFTGDSGTGTHHRARRCPSQRLQASVGPERSRAPFLHHHAGCRQGGYHASV